MELYYVHDVHVSAQPTCANRADVSTAAFEIEIYEFKSYLAGTVQFASSFTEEVSSPGIEKAQVLITCFYPFWHICDNHSTES